MTTVQKLEEVSRGFTRWLTAGSYDPAIVELCELLDDAAKRIRHLELMHVQAIKALGEHTGADILVVPK